MEIWESWGGQAPVRPPSLRPCRVVSRAEPREVYVSRDEHRSHPGTPRGFLEQGRQTWPAHPHRARTIGATCRSVPVIKHRIHTISNRPLPNARGEGYK